MSMSDDASAKVRDGAGSIASSQDEKVVNSIPAVQTWGSSVRRAEGRRSSMKGARGLDDDDEAISPRSTTRGRRSRQASKSSDIAEILDSLTWDNSQASISLSVPMNSGLGSSSSLTGPDSSNTKLNVSQRQFHLRMSALSRDIMSSKSTESSAKDGSHSSGLDVTSMQADQGIKSANEPIVFPLTLLPQKGDRSVKAKSSQAIIPEATTDSTANSRNHSVTAEELASRALMKRRGSKLGAEGQSNSARLTTHGPLYKHLHQDQKEKFEADSAKPSTTSFSTEYRDRTGTSTATLPSPISERRGSIQLSVSLSHISDSRAEHQISSKTRRRRQISGKSRLHGSSSTSLTYDMDEESPLSVKGGFSAATSLDSNKSALKSRLAAPIVSGRDSDGVDSSIRTTRHGRHSLQQHFKSNRINASSTVSINQQGNRGSMHSVETLKASHADRRRTETGDQGSLSMSQNSARRHRATKSSRRTHSEGRHDPHRAGRRSHSRRLSGSRSSLTREEEPRRSHSLHRQVLRAPPESASQVSSAPLHHRSHSEPIKQKKDVEIMERRKDDSESQPANLSVQGNFSESSLPIDSPNQKRIRERMVSVMKTGITMLSIVNLTKREAAEDAMPRNSLKSSGTADLCDNLSVVQAAAESDASKVG